MATGTNAELLKLSSRRDPYPGKLGVVDEGPLADVLVVGRRSHRQHRLDRRSATEFPCDHEGREDIQEFCSLTHWPFWRTSGTAWYTASPTRFE